MRLSFPGTRGEIDSRTPLHRMHSCVLVERRILVDCGTDWLGVFDTLEPQAIVLTHAHPDHAGVLKHGAPCAVYATPETWQKLRRYRIVERITRSGWSVFYAPDVSSIHDQRDALSRIALYMGDGVSITRGLIRRRGERTIGHASVRTQLEWCRQEGISRAVITHCGSEIVKGEAESVAARVRALGDERGMDVVVAHDGMELAITAKWLNPIRRTPRGFC